MTKIGPNASSASRRRCARGASNRRRNGSHCTNTRKPRTRYTVGRDAALITFLARILPDRILDLLFAAALRPHFPKESK